MSVRVRLTCAIVAGAILAGSGVAAASPEPADAWMQACVAKLQRARPSWPARFAGYAERIAILPAVPEFPGAIRYELYEGDDFELAFEIKARFDGQLWTPRRRHQGWKDFRDSTGWDGARLKSARHDVRIDMPLRSAATARERAEAERMARALKEVGEWCLDRADRFPKYLPTPDLRTRVLLPTCDRACTCTFTGAPLFTEPLPGPVAIEFFGPLLSRTYRAENGRLTTTLARWIDLLAGRSEIVATTAGSHVSWSEDHMEPGLERPWPHRLIGSGTDYEARPDRIVFTEIWGPRPAATLSMPLGQQLITWRQGAPYLWLLVALASGERVSWYLVRRPDIRMDETHAIYCE